eukprot:31641_1
MSRRISGASDSTYYMSDSSASRTFNEQSFEQEKHELEKLCDAVVSARRDSGGDVAGALQNLRIHVLLKGIPDEHEIFPVSAVCSEVPGEGVDNPNYLPMRKTEMTLRGRVWLLMLGLDEIDGEIYLDLCKRKQCKLYNKIRSDSFRTFPDTMFQQVVPEQRIIRVLNAFVHEYGDVFAYVQGMNIILAPFLYTMPEVNAFFAFCKFITQCFPIYWINYVCGAKAGCKLVDECLEVSDNKLYNHITSMGLHCEIYGFHGPVSNSIRPSILGIAQTVGHSHGVWATPKCDNCCCSSDAQTRAAVLVQNSKRLQHDSECTPCHSSQSAQYHPYAHAHILAHPK